MTRNYRFFVEPLNAQANEAIAEWLNSHGRSAASLEVKSIQVLGRTIPGVYMVSHDLITKLKQSTHFKSVRVYVQEGEGIIRTYAHYTKKRGLANTKPVKAVLQKLRTMT